MTGQKESVIEFGHDGPVSTLTALIWLARPPSDVFAFFADAGNLDALTPPWLTFRIVTPGPIAMGKGALIDYRLRVHGLPLRWQSEITAWEPTSRFVDEQLRGPYRLWVHEHRFEEADGGTFVSDIVRYKVLGGRLLDKLFVRNDLKAIFHYRQERLQQIFGRSKGPGEN